jgi:pimeloyl-ACP methyl ester carboxylesterase
VGANHVDDHTIALDGCPVFYRSGSPGRTRFATVYLHGVPTSSDDWTAFLEQTGGIAPDLIGFGRSGKGGHLDYTPAGLARFLERLLDELGIARLNLVAHDWGVVVAILLAAAHPDRVQRLVLIAPPPALDQPRFSGLARAWRAPVLGELAMGSITRTLFVRRLRRGSVNPAAWPEHRTRPLWDQFDQGTQRAMLRLYRSWDDERRRATEAALDDLEVPALLAWGDRDPWSGPAAAQSYASRLRHPRLEEVKRAGHWPWLDDASFIGLVADWLD